MPRRPHWSVVVACVVGLLPVAYWWSLGPVAYASNRWPSATMNRASKAYGLPSHWLASRWAWYAGVEVKHRQQWGEAGFSRFRP